MIFVAGFPIINIFLIGFWDRDSGLFFIALVEPAQSESLI